MVTPLGLMPLIEPSLPPARRSGITPFFIAVHCANEKALIANGFLAFGIVVLSCSSANIDLWVASQFWPMTAPLRSLLLKNEYVPDSVWGANFTIVPAVPPTCDQSLT